MYIEFCENYLCYLIYEIILHLWIALVQLFWTELSQALLSQGKGAAFVASPSSGALAPFAEEILEIAAYSDMWGNYKDRLVCKVR